MGAHSDRTPCWQTRSLLAWCILSTVVLLVLLPLDSIAENYGYDSASSCDPARASRRGRSQLLKTIPCDLSVQAYCNLPGSAYPWHAVRRFVHENQGLMRRMYGDVRHISVLKEEFENNEIEIDDIERATERYSRATQASEGHRERRVDGGKRMKYLRPSSPQHYDGLGHYLRDKSNEIPFNEPHFRPAQLKTTTTGRPTTPTVARGALSATNDTSNATSTTRTPTTTTTTTATARTTTRTTVTPTSRITATGTPTTAGGRTSTTTSRSTATSTTVESPLRTVSTVATIPDETDSSTKRTTVDRFEPAVTSVPVSAGAGNKDPTPSGSASAAEGATATGENDKIRSNSVAEVELLADSSKLHPVEAEAIDMETLSSLAKLETGEALSKADEPEEKGVGDDILGGKISSTLKLSAAASGPPPPVEPVEPGAAPGSNPNDRQDTIVASALEDVDSKGVVDLGAAAGNEPVTEPLVQDDSIASGSTVQQQKIRFESINKGGSAGVGVSAGLPAAKKPAPGAEGQLFQDVAQKEPPVVTGRGVNACPVKEEVVAPFWANNTRGEVLALLNLYPFEQYVHWEKCTHELKQMYCREGCRCEQQYRLHRLLAYDPHNECRGIFSDWFRFPSCCICKCYDMPFDFRVTSRSPRSVTKESIELVEDELQNAIYEHATDDWYRPKEHTDLD